MTSQAAPRSSAERKSNPYQMAPRVVFPHDRTRRARRDPLPFVKSALYTLSISYRFLASQLVGNGTVERCDELMDWWAEKIFTSGNAELTTTGTEYLDLSRPYVFMSNHVSVLDIPGAIVAAPHSIRMVMKEELKHMPVWGQALVASGFVPVSRSGDRKKAVRQMAEAKRQLARGVSIWVFPEGTRSPDGRLCPLKKGGFHLARDLGVQIVPAWISGTRDAISPRKMTAEYNQKCRVDFGRPVSTEGAFEDVMSTVTARLEHFQHRADQRG